MELNVANPAVFLITFIWKCFPFMIFYSGSVQLPKYVSFCAFCTHETKYESVPAEVERAWPVQC